MDPDYLLKTLFKKISAAFHSFAWFKHFLDNGLIFEKKIDLGTKKGATK